MRKLVSVVIPVYQNQETIEIVCDSLVAALNLHRDNFAYQIILVNDGSTDDSWSVMSSLLERKLYCPILINLTRNFGQVPALLAGYNYADGECVVSMSADMQDPPELVAEMILAWDRGNKLVVADRTRREDGAVTSFFSRLAWRLLNRFVIPGLPKGGFDFFAMDRAIKDFFISNPEQHLFLQGRVLFYGCIPYLIPYTRRKRVSGRSQSKFFWRVNYFLDAIVGYSYAPLRIVSFLGILFFICSLIAIFYIIWAVTFGGSSVPGWASTIVVLLFLNGIQMLILGVVGEYLWRGLGEIRKRPLFLVDQVVDRTHR